MNLFRLVADLSHLASIFILWYLIEKRQLIEGLSLKTQVLYVVVFATRYLDLFTNYVSLYNSLMKVLLIGSLSYVVYLMTRKYNKSIHEDLDTFPVWMLIAALAVAALVFTHLYRPQEYLWSFSIWLELVAILPQLFMLQRKGLAEVITTHYIFALGIYRALYIPNWIYRYFFENHFDYVSFLAGVVQTLIYSDFFYHYFYKVMQGKSFELPV